MLVANYSEFRTQLKHFLDKFENDRDTLIIKRSGGKGAVLISLEDYNSLMETMYLLSNKANADHLRESIQQYKEGKYLKVDMSELDKIE